MNTYRSWLNFILWLLIVVSLCTTLLYIVSNPGSINTRYLVTAYFGLILGVFTFKLTKPNNFQRSSHIAVLAKYALFLVWSALVPYLFPVPPYDWRVAAVLICSFAYGFYVYFRWTALETLIER